MRKIYVLVGAFMIFGCQGTVGADHDLVGADDPSKENNQNETTDPGSIGPAFSFERSNVRLLPFHVRMNKLATVTGLPTTDPVFSELRANRYVLGDHNYGENIGADLNWNASKMGIWVESIQPVCASEAMAQRYPSLPENLSDLWLTAYSREMEPGEADPILAIDVSNLDEAGRYETFCVAVLTSAEFVAQ